MLFLIFLPTKDSTFCSVFLKKLHIFSGINWQEGDLLVTWVYNVSSSHFCSRHKNEERTPSFMQSARLGKATLRGHHLPPRCFCGEKLPFGLNHFLVKEYYTSKWLRRGWCSELTKQKLSSKYLAPDNRNFTFGVAICLTFFVHRPEIKFVHK